MGWAVQGACCAHPCSAPSVPGWMGEPRRCQWSCSQLSLQPRLLQGCLWKGTVGQAQGPEHCEQAVQVGSQPKPERKGKKWVSFLELCLAPTEAEGPMILHHFAFSLPPLTQAVPRTGCAVPGPARARRMPEQELQSHEDAVGSPCPAPALPSRELLPGSCSPVTLFSGRELQFAFICFLIGNVYDAFEHWKRLLNILCRSEEAMGKYQDLYINLISVLYHQLNEIPADFFVDIVSQDNFLTSTLQVLFSCTCSSAVDAALRNKAEKFKAHLTKKFRWDFEAEPEDCAPVVVELPEGVGVGGV
uniref:Protein AAR2 homolog n=1 Tax=Zonotrichia albicollis TaxID=44394 RepID=A0A8D2MMV0_ZONAL